MKRLNKHTQMHLEIINSFNPNFALCILFLKYLTLLITLQVTEKLK